MKKLLIAFTGLILILSAAGCSKLADLAQSKAGSAAAAAGTATVADSSGENESSPVKTEADLACTNSYLGFSCTIPKNWWIDSVNENNFAEDPSQTESPVTLDINYGKDAGMNYSFIEMVSFANLMDSRRENHIGFHISAETLDGVNSLAEYMVYYESYMLEPDENTYEMLETGRAEINGLQYERRAFEVQREQDNFIYVTYTRPVENNYYLTIKASCWPANGNAEIFIEDTLSKVLP